MATVEAIDVLLPQTQCTRCGYPECHAYATALARGETDINRCPPGGEDTIDELARLLGRPAKTLDPEVGSFAAGSVALIEEPVCIGCTKCIQACPVDAITGAAKQMHTVIEALCTGCGLCLPPCPVDCIRIVPAEGVTEGLEGWQFPMAGTERATALRGRYALYRQHRDEAEAHGRAQHSAAEERKARHLAEIAAARARVQAKRGIGPKH